MMLLARDGVIDWTPIKGRTARENDYPSPSIAELWSFVRMVDRADRVMQCQDLLE